MASLKAEKPAGSQLFGQVKKDPPKAAGEGASKAKPAPKKTEQKPKETKKKQQGDYLQIIAMQNAK
ncbi:hypothetical protein Scep_022358 [Stephania cephalantha]|uniref:Uncharacterized protein n=1 Tax=Stephania cephalantha TaxID=152367 RepID=A0AAP0F606_9MAGN